MDRGTGGQGDRVTGGHVDRVTAVRVTSVLGNICTGLHLDR